MKLVTKYCLNTLIYIDDEDHYSENGMYNYLTKCQDELDAEWHHEVFDQMSSDPQSKPQKIRWPNDAILTSLPLITDE